ncbi:MAG: methylmalonyl-CoA mutase family protein [Flavobacteriaceae bacterium]
MNSENPMEEPVRFNAQQWKQLLQWQLDGKSYQELISPEIEGIQIKPFYDQEDLPKIVPDLTHPQKVYLQERIRAKDAQGGWISAQEALSKGADHLRITWLGSSTEALALMNKLGAFSLVQHWVFYSVTEELIDLLSGLSPAVKETIRIEWDPLARVAITGNWFTTQQNDLAQWRQMHTHLALDHLCIDASRYQESGGSIIQQLAYTMAQLEVYFDLLPEPIESTGQVIRQVHVYTVNSGDFFMELAKIKALRWLVVSMGSWYGLSLTCHVTVRPSRRNKTAYQTTQNTLKSAAELLSGLMGGASSLAPLAHNELIQSGDVQAQQEAFHQLAILVHETGLVGQDLGAGSYYLAYLTDQWAQKALVLNQSIRNSGGWIKAMNQGIIQQKIEQHHIKTLKAYQALERKKPSDKDLDTTHWNKSPFSRYVPKKTSIALLPVRRLSEADERKWYRL